MLEMLLTVKFSDLSRYLLCKGLESDYNFKIYIIKSGS